jgi:uncharacterized membrane protein
VDRKRQIVKWYAIVPLTLAVVAVAVPWLMAHSPQLGFALQRGFALVCHQRAERSFFLFGGSIAVCARCLGIYLGASVGLMVRVPHRIAWHWLLVAAALNLADWLAEFGGIHGNWMVTRLVLGIALGVGAGLLVAASYVGYTTPTPAKAA